MGLVEEVGKLPWWAVALADEYVVQMWVLIRFGKVAPPVSKCVGWFWRGANRAGLGQLYPTCMYRSQARLWVMPG